MTLPPPKKNFRSTPLMNINAQILKKYVLTKSSNALKIIIYCDHTHQECIDGSTLTASVVADLSLNRSYWEILGGKSNDHLYNTQKASAQNSKVILDFERFNRLRIRIFPSHSEMYLFRPKPLS